MSMIIFPAPAGTNLAHKDLGIVAPIIAFAYIQGTLAFPLFAIPGREGCGKHEAIVHGDGHVSYPTGSRMFSSLGEWMAFMEEADAEETEGVEAGPDNRPLVFGDTTYKTKSYWHWPIANAIFEIDGDEAIPNDPRAKKIKRDEYAELKRQGAVKVDPHAGVIEEEAAAPVAETEEDDEDYGI